MYIKEPKTLEEKKELLDYKRVRLKVVWEKMDSYTREYDRLLREIDKLCYEIKNEESLHFEKLKKWHN